MQNIDEFKIVLVTDIYSIWTDNGNAFIRAVE